MARLTYLFDTNAISALVEQDLAFAARVRANQTQNVVCLCTPVHFEVRRGLLHTNSTRKALIYEQQVRPLFQWIRLEDQDWEQAAIFWASTRKRGKQFSDIDLLVAAIATRLDAVIISADKDFDALPVKRENWRE